MPPVSVGVGRVIPNFASSASQSMLLIKFFPLMQTPGISSKASPCLTKYSISAPAVTTRDSPPTIIIAHFLGSSSPALLHSSGNFCSIFICSHSSLEYAPWQSEGSFNFSHASGVKAPASTHSFGKFWFKVIDSHSFFV